jgi:Hom_end-associated Hint
MSSQNIPYEMRMKQLQGRVMAAAKLVNPTAKEFSGMDYQQSARITRTLGQMTVVVQPTTNPRYEVAPCCTGTIAAPAPAPCDLPGGIILIGISDVSDGVIFPYDLSYNMFFDVSWEPVAGATSYGIQMAYDFYNGVETVLIPITEFSIFNRSLTDISIYTQSSYSYITLTIQAINECGASMITTDGINPCFLAGSLVQMADGSTKPIEEVLVGDLVLGAFGEINEVLALHRPLLGSAQMCRINGEHSTTSHHPHISVDRGFYCMHPSVVEETTYGHEHEVINAAGEKELRMLYGLAAGRVRELVAGVELKVVDGGRVVSELELYSMPADTQLYNLVVGGSHTYHVDGYAVTGWPREDDFDYDNWVAR